MTVEIQERQKVWRPNDGPQTEFLQLPDSIFEGFYGGAAGGGKSQALMMLPLVRGFIDNPAFKGIIFRRTFPQLEESLIALSKTGIGFRDGQPGPSYYDFGGRYNDSKHVWTFESGATIRFSSLDSEDDVYDHKTAEFHYIAFDELTAFTRFMYIYMTSRCRSVDPRLPAIVRSASNPGDIGHLWVRERFVEPDRHGRKKLLLRNLAGTVTTGIFIPAKLKDNPCLNEADPGYETRLDILPETERRALKDGDWWTFAGQFFKEFRVHRTPLEPENAVHVVEPFEIPYFWPKILSVDWGYDHKNAVHCSAIAPDGRLYVFYEDVRRKTLISQWAPDVSLELNHFRETIKAAIIDPSSNRHDGQEETIKEQVARYSGFTFEDADNSRISGWQLVRDFMRWIPRPPKFKPAGGYSEVVSQRILRMQGEKAQASYLDLFKPDEPEVNIPRLQIFSICKDLINTIPLAIHDEKHPEDVQKFDGDDSLDEIRYNIKAVHRYVEDCKTEYESIQKRQSVLDGLNKTGDMTSFYRAMERFEDENRVVPFILRRRFHGFKRRSAIR
jgi:hypothetical protein